MAAGGVDVATAGFADVAGYGAHHDSLEVLHPVVFGHIVGDAGARVKCDQVDFAVEVADQADQAPGIGIGVIESAEQNIFDKDAFFGAEWEMFAGFQQVFEVPFLGDWHDFLALLLAGGIEADGESGANVGLAEFDDFGDKARGGYGDATLPHADAALVYEEARGLQNVVEVHQRLALAHHDDVHGSSLGIELMLGHDVQDLADNFAGAEVAFQTHEGGEAEFAIYWTAHLRGYANGVTIALRHKDCFYGLAVMELHEVADGAVRTGVAGGLGEGPRTIALAERGGQSSDFV